MNPFSSYSIRLFFSMTCVMCGVCIIPAQANPSAHDPRGSAQEKSHHDHDDDPQNHRQQESRHAAPHAESTGSDEHTGDEGGHGHHNNSKDNNATHEAHHGSHEHEGGYDDVIELDEEARSMIQLQTEIIRKRRLSGQLKVYGKIALDTEHYSYVTFEHEGYVHKIHIRPGDVVDKGDVLMTVRRDDGVMEDIVSDTHGLVASIFVKPRERVDRLTSLISIINVDIMRAAIDIYEKDLPVVHVGQKVVVTTEAYPGRTFEGTVGYISPQVDEHTQSIKVRVDIKNHEHLLRLGMFVAGTLIYASDKTVLAVPASAVQRLNGTDVVFVLRKENLFEIREVVLGRKSKTFIEVKKGLKEGERVVTHGSFYLKSEKAKESFGEGHAH